MLVMSFLPGFAVNCSKLFLPPLLIFSKSLPSPVFLFSFWLLLEDWLLPIATRRVICTQSRLGWAADGGRWNDYRFIYDEHSHV